MEVKFCWSRKNHNAIANRGWNPLSRNPILDPSIQATMTNQEIAKKSKCTSFQLPSALLDKNNIQPHILSCEASTSIGTVTDILYHQTSLNFSSRTSLFCLTSIVNKQQLMQARERI